jgi:cytochrome P450
MSIQETGAVVELDVDDPQFQHCPYPQLARARAASGVCPVPSRGWYVVTRAELVREALRDTGRFSSQVHKHSQPPPEVADEIAAIRAQGWPYTPALGTNDPPQHTRYRKLINQLFTPRRLSSMQPLVEHTADELARALPDGRVVDFFTAFAQPLPVWAISRIVGLSDEQRSDVQRWTRAATASIGATPSADRWVEHENDLLHMQFTLAAALESHRGTPADTVLGRLAAALEEQVGPDGDPPPTVAVLLTLLRELVVAGNETTARLLTEIVRLLHERPDEWARVRADPDRADLIAEEALRWASPTQSALRRVTRDTTLGGVPLAAGTTLMLSFASANRDDELFGNADAFDPERGELRQHVAFGLGPHMCVGAGLARMELRIAVQTLARYVDALDVVEAQSLTYTQSFTIRGLQALPVTVRRRVASTVAGVR